MRSLLTVCILINHSLGLNPSDVLPSLHHPRAPSTNQVPYTYSTNTIEIPHKYQTYIIQILSYKRHTIQILYLCHFHPHQYSFISLPIKLQSWQYLMNTLKIPYKLTNTTQISYKQHKSTFINIFPTQYSNMCKKRPFGCLVRNHDLLSRANVRCQQQQQHSVKCRSNQVKCYVKLQCKLQFKMQYKMQCEMQRRMK